jgi:transglutaminase-like putative cysteine protease
MIGHEGRIKFSNKIVLRARVLPGEIPPPLLRESAYDSYKNGTWWATSNELISLPMSGSSNDTLRLLPPKLVGSAVEVSQYLPNGEGTLALPHGTFELENFPAVAKTNRLGVTYVESGQGLMNIYAHYGGGASLDGPPSAMDLIVPDNERRILDKVAGDLHLADMTERQRIRAVSLYFREHFKYSLNIPRTARDSTALGQFLTRTKAGHCQYFATATVLLLREAGVNARYITGYAVPESARRGDTYLLRERHAHAWALVYHSDTRTWEQIDTTPSGWTESEGMPWWQAAPDFFSNVYFQFSKWRWGKTSFAHYAEWFLVPLILYLVIRIITSQRRKSIAGADRDGTDIVWPGLDSELFVINHRLAEVHLSRQPQEPLANWQRRLEEAFPTSGGLRRIFQLHRRLRFDPIGLESNDRQTLRREAEAWLADHTPPAKRQTPP